MCACLCILLIGGEHYFDVLWCFWARRALISLTWRAVCCKLHAMMTMPGRGDDPLTLFLVPSVNFCFFC